MKISELMRRVGDAKIKVQNLQSSLTGTIRANKKDGTISFVTEKALAQDLMNCVLTGGTTKMIGLIVWLPADEVAKAMETAS